jgi:hypothetical protein
MGCTQTPVMPVVMRSEGESGKSKGKGGGSDGTSEMLPFLRLRPDRPEGPKRGLFLLQMRRNLPAASHTRRASIFLQNYP